MYKANLNFDNDFDEMLIRELSNYNFSIAPTMSSEELRLKFFNFQRRLIQPIPRQILISKEFTCPPYLENGLKIVKEKLEKGENLTPHLSKNINNLNYNDPLLNDWKIYHLHLGEKITKGGFMQRTGPVLFVRIDPDKAYLINVHPHGSWTKQQMVKVIHDNWPESIESYRMKDVIGLSHVPTDDDIKSMRKFGVNSALEIEPGVFYLPIGGGLTTAKTSSEVSLAVIHSHNLLQQLQKHVEDNLQEIGKKVTEKTGRTDEDLFLKLIIQDNVYYAVEQNTKLVFKLYSY